MTEIDSTSDERTINNTMRHKYKVLTESEKAQMLQIKDMGLDFYRAVDELAHGFGSRELYLAKTKIEEAVMWAVKHITG